MSGGSPIAPIDGEGVDPMDVQVTVPEVSAEALPTPDDEELKTVSSVQFQKAQNKRTKQDTAPKRKFSL